MTPEILSSITLCILFGLAAYLNRGNEGVGIGAGLFAMVLLAEAVGIWTGGTV